LVKYIIEIIKIVIILDDKVVTVHDGLTFKQLGWYLNFSAWFMENVLFEQKMVKYEINCILWEMKLRLCRMS
jgi:hypothetical protein